tara:strand:+ start:123214 stop:123753 length:540 start_codon:yes stop_codon:yes gene_type:complete
MIIDLKSHTIEAIQENDTWKLCDFLVSNADRFKRYFPQTLAQNSNPTLSRIFVVKKIAEFESKKEFLFTLKEKEQKTIIGLVYLKKIDWNAKRAELAYCIGYQFEGLAITSKTVRYISNWAFDTLGLDTLEIIAHKTNLGSVGVAKKCGFTWRNTLLKEHTPPNEAPLDMELYELYNER